MPSRASASKARATSLRNSPNSPDRLRSAPQLAPRERSPASVATLIALNRGEQLPFHLHRTRDNGIRGDEWVEPVTHLALHAGWACAASAVSALRALDTATTP